MKASPKGCLLFAKNAAFVLEVLPQMLDSNCKYPPAAALTS
jgi:hypothetical protein